MKQADDRLERLRLWLPRVLDNSDFVLTPASSDASFRRYFRVQNQGKTFIVMDSPPQQEPIEPFLHCRELLADQGINVPDIFASDTKLGLILLEDFGDTCYLQALPTHAEPLYTDALACMHQIQTGPSGATLPALNAEALNIELDLFERWYVEQHLSCSFSNPQRSTWRTLKSVLIAACEEQPQVWVHRDYHSRNLMVVKDENPGVIDFQGMVLGPMAYDLASLFKDCYIDWPREAQLKWCQRYLEGSNTFGLSLTELTRWYDLTAMQRHLKVLGIFTRLYYRDAKPAYLKDLARVRNYLFETLSLYSEFMPFKRIFAELPHR